MATFLSVILLDVDLGLIVGICVSILVIVIRLVVLVMIFIEKIFYFNFFIEINLFILKANVFNIGFFAID